MIYKQDEYIYNNETIAYISLRPSKHMTPMHQRHDR